MKREPVWLGTAARIVVALAAWAGLDLPAEVVLGVLAALEPLLAVAVRSKVSPTQKPVEAKP